MFTANDTQIIAEEYKFLETKIAAKQQAIATRS